MRRPEVVISGGEGGSDGWFTVHVEERCADAGWWGCTEDG